LIGAQSDRQDRRLAEQEERLRRQEEEIARQRREIEELQKRGRTKQADYSYGDNRGGSAFGGFDDRLGPPN
jgi:hypothetical protein